MSANPAQQYRRPALLNANHFRDARIYATRADMLSGLQIAAGGVIAEVGVGIGEFSERLMSTFQPRQFVAFDLFEMHQFREHWGVPSSELLKGMSHLDYFKHRFSRDADKLVLERGLSRDTIPLYPDQYFDFIYVDAGHDYESVREDAEVCSRKIKPSGILMFNDYTLYDPFLQVPYGVVQAVNELVVNSDWKVIGFSLECNMFCDIAIQR